MDERIQKALEASNFRLNLLNTKENLKIKFDTMITVAINGGFFKATRELITFVQLVINKGSTSIVLIDENDNPIEIKDLENFLEDLLDKYFQATNFYNSEYTRLKRARSTTEQFAEIMKEA